MEEDTFYDSRDYRLPPEELEHGVEEDQRPVPALNGLRVAFVLCITMLGVQCFRLQVSQGAQNRAQAESNSIKLINVPADRGLIEDSKGTIIAQNTRQLALAINPQTLPAKKTDRQTVYDLLQKKAGIDSQTIAIIEDTTHPTDPSAFRSPDIFTIKSSLTKDESLLYQEWFAATPGVLIQEAPIRQYTSFTSMGHLLGYVGQATENDIKSNGAIRGQILGKGGLEEQYNDLLGGIPGKQKAEVDAAGNIVRTLSGGTVVQPGTTLRISLDTNLQKIVAASLQNAIELRSKTFGDATKKLGASAVILNPSNGAILAMVSLPDYDGNLFANGISQANYKKLLDDPADPLLNRAIQGLYPSGSVIKPIIAAGALQDGIVTANRTLDTSSPVKIGGFTFPDWKTHGTSDIRKAIAQSNDIFFYAIGGGLPSQGVKGLGIDALNKVLNGFGFGTPTGIDLPGEEAGLTPGPDWKEQNIKEDWYIGDTYHQSIGQGYFLTTPLQIAAATAAIANGGTLYQPQLGWSTVDPITGKERLMPHKVLNSNWISAANIRSVQEGMEMTTQPGGTAQLLGKLTVVTAGKTGTAEFGTDGLTHSWYSGYAPAKDPKYVIAILIEGDGNVTEATESSEPVAEEILRGIFNQPLEPGQPLFTQALLPGGTKTTTPEATPTPSPTPTPTPAP